MKRLALGSLIITFAASGAMAQMAPSTVHIIIPSVELAVEKNVEKSDPGCSASGVKIMDSVALRVGLVRNSTSILKDLLQQTADQTNTLEQDASHCGGTCQEVNTVSTMTATVPDAWGDVGSCTSQTPQVLQKDFANNDELQSYVNDTLQAKNGDGKTLNAACPSPCSYHVASSITPEAGDAKHLSLSVLCGPPRSGSLIFAKYFFSAGLIQQWSCKKK